MIAIVIVALIILTLIAFIVILIVCGVAGEKLAYKYHWSLLTWAVVGVVSGIIALAIFLPLLTFLLACLETQ